MTELTVHAPATNSMAGGGGGGTAEMRTLLDDTKLVPPLACTEAARDDRGREDLQVRGVLVIMSG